MWVKKALLFCRAIFCDCPPSYPVGRRAGRRGLMQQLLPVYGIRCEQTFRLLIQGKIYTDVWTNIYIGAMAGDRENTLETENKIVYIKEGIHIFLI